MSMIHSRVLKQIKHIKGSQIADNQSVISHSRSSASYQFNQIKFSKPYQAKDKQNKNTFHLESVLKAKSKHKQCKNEYGVKKTSRENSLSSLLEKEPIGLTLKKKENQKLEHKLKKFMRNVRSIHSQMKELAESMLGIFERIKQEMEGNLMKVTEEVLRLNGEMVGVERIHQIIHRGFEAIRKVAVLPLQSMSQLKNFSQKSIIDQYKQKQQKQQTQQKRRNTSRQPPLTPMMKPNHEQRRRTDMIYNSAFSSQLISPKCGFSLERLNLNSVSKSKARAQTERKKGEIDGERGNKPQQIVSTERKVKEELLTMRSSESTYNIDCIISQMRQILNEQVVRREKNTQES